MNILIAFFTEIAVTLIACLLIVGYFRPHLRGVLCDLCGTEQRAQFWTVFANILLVGLPFVVSLGFHPEEQTLEAVFFEIIGRLSGNLAAFLFALVAIGLMVSFFALVAPPKPTKMEQK